MLDKLRSFFDNFFSRVAFPGFGFSAVIEILILAFLLYHVIKWIRRTRALTLVKGLIMLFIAWVIAYFMDFTVILWLFANTITVGITAIIILFQPELRKVLEELGQKNMMFSSLASFGKETEKHLFSDDTLKEIVKATFEMAKVKTGALIVIEDKVPLQEFVDTGIQLDANLSNQLLINIFEHNTPLHDGAVIVKGDRVVAATCYLPLSDNMFLSKELGTRHRAGVGISEISDSLTIIVSEETGKVSVASNGTLTRNLSAESLEELLRNIQRKNIEPSKIKKLWKGKKNHEKVDNQ